MSFLTLSTTSRIIPPLEELSDPFTIDANGATGSSQDPDVWARQHLIALLMTSPGERVMRPNYGCGLFHFVFENGDPLRAQQLVSNIRNQVQAYEPTILIQDITFIPSTSVAGVLQINLSYSVNNSNQVHTLSFNSTGQGVEL